MMILGSMGLVKAYDIRIGEKTMLGQDMPIMIGVTILFIVVLALFKQLPRWIGILFVIGYCTYMGLLAYQSL